MKILTKIIRILTIPPIMAFIMLTTLFVLRPEVFGGPLLYGLAVFFISVLPVLAYPLQPVIPGFKGKGREGQRNLAMWFSVAGYLLGCIVNIFMNASLTLWLVYLVYLFSGLGIFICSKLFHFKASGHACGIMGPIAFLLYTNIYGALVGIPVYFAALWASVKMKRHTVAQFISGAAIPVIALFILVNVFSFI